MVGNITDQRRTYARALGEFILVSFVGAMRPGCRIGLVPDCHG
jgi:hypothetical protein